MSQQAVYSYDSIGRLNTVTFANGAQISYHYDETGNRTSVVTVPAVESPTSFENGFRLSADSTEPVPTADLWTNILYLLPYKSNQISLYYDGAWQAVTSSGASLNLETTASIPYDVFASYDGTNVNLSLVEWSSVSARATALGYQDGVLVLSTDSTKLYVGTIYCYDTNTLFDRAAGRHIWNYYNRVARAFYCADTSATWSYNSTTPHNANGNDTDGEGRFSFVAGLAEDSLVVSAVQAMLCDYPSWTATSSANIIALDSVTTSLQAITYSTAGNAGTSTAGGVMQFAAGYHNVQRMEACEVSGITCTFLGAIDAPTSGYMSGQLLM